MAKKIVSLIERDAADELKAYLDSTTLERPLDCHEEMVLLERFLPEAVSSYINRFRFSQKAELAFITKAPVEMRQSYINYYGLLEATQKVIIDQNMVAPAQDFLKMRRFWDEGYLLDHASDAILRPYVSLNVFEGDELVFKLLARDNPTLFQSYVNKGRYISQAVIREVISSRNEHAFKALMYRFYSAFRKKARKTADFDKIMKAMATLALNAEQQEMVLLSFDRMMVQILLQTSPLAPSAQNILFRHNFDAQWLKLHAANVYGMGGYRFTPENEEKLFKLLASKNLDECLTNFRQRDDVSFVRLATVDAISKYIKEFWLTDDAQIALLERGNIQLAKELISRYSPEHGLCWQAELVLAQKYSEEVLKGYISFHTMCFEAQDIIRARKMDGVMEYYFTLHSY